VVGKDLDADFDQPGAYAHLRAATTKPDEDAPGANITELRFPVAGVRPLAPAPRHSVCAWVGNSIHYGGACSAHSLQPRISLAVTLCAARVGAVAGCEQLLGMPALLELSLAQRLAYIARSLLSHSNWYELSLSQVELG
jgi:hypothetical protein